MKAIIKTIGRDLTLTLFKKVVQVQADKGKVNEQFKGYKTPGGVFMEFVKQERPETKKIFREDKKYKKQKNFINEKLGGLALPKEESKSDKK